MTWTGISNRGLLVIASLVAILWGSIFVERAIIQQARRETELLLRSREPVRVKYRNQRPRPPTGFRSLPKSLRSPYSAEDYS